MAGRQYYSVSLHQNKETVWFSQLVHDKKNHPNQLNQVCLTVTRYGETMFCLETYKNCINRKLRQKRQEVANRMFCQCFVLSKRLINIQYEHSGLYSTLSILCICPAGTFASYCFNQLCCEYTPSVCWFYSEPVCLEDRQKDKSLCCNQPGKKVCGLQICENLCLLLQPTLHGSAHTFPQHSQT